MSSESASQLKELLQFLEPSQRPDLKLVAMEYIVGQTGNAAGIQSISEEPEMFRRLIDLLKDPVVGKQASVALVNLSADPTVAKTLLQSNDMSGLVRKLYDLIQDPECKIADAITMILSNLTRDKVSCRAVWDKFAAENIEMERLVFLLCQEDYNKHGATLKYLGPVLSNLSQLLDVRRALLDHEKCVIQRLLPFTEYSKSLIKKGGIIGTLRNCCFQSDEIPWLIGEDVDIIPRLLLPLAGPTPECFTEEEMDKLPVELQYLDEDKTRESDPDLRKMLLEALTQLCATRVGREALREKNAYLILRELHKEEKDREVLLACENIVDILIKKEEEIEVENYKEVEVPGDLEDQFSKMDELYLKD